MGMNQEGDGMVPITERMVELLDDLKEHDEDDLYSRLCQANQMGEPHITFYVGEKVILKDHQWEVTEMLPARLILRPLHRLP